MGTLKGGAYPSSDEKEHVGERVDHKAELFGNFQDRNYSLAHGDIKRQ